MSDHPDPLLARRLASLTQDLAAVTWAEPEAVRARGRDLGRRAAIATALAVLLVVGLGTAGAWQFVASGSTAPVGHEPSKSQTSDTTTGDTAPTTPPPTPAETGPVTVPTDWLIQPGDLGPGWGVQAPGAADPLVTVEMRLGTCSLQPPSTAQVRGTGSTRLANEAATPSTGIPDRTAVRLALEKLQVFVTGGAQEYLDTWRQLITRCPVVTPGPESTTYTSIVDERFAGDDSVLLEFQVVTSGSGGYTDFIALVRRGDRVAVVAGSQVGTSIDSYFTRWLATIAASRMCGTSGC